MRRYENKTRQIAFGALIALSLFASTVAACVCAHHAEKKVEVETSSCHTQPEAESAANSEKFGRLKSHDECVCLDAAPRVLQKTETVKIEKQAAIESFTRVRPETFYAAPPVEGCFFEKPFYLTDSFYNLKSPRAPPAA